MIWRWKTVWVVRALPFVRLPLSCRAVARYRAGTSLSAGSMELMCRSRHFTCNRNRVHRNSMTEQSNMTPPIADLLKQLEEAQLNLEKGVFPADGLIAPASDGDCYIVRVWDKTGPKIVQCATASDAIIRLTEAKAEALSGRYVARQVSHRFYQSFFEAVDARSPLTITETEARLCGVAKKIAEAILLYDTVIRGGDESKAIPKSRARAIYLGLDRLIQRANDLYAKVEAEAAADRT